MPWPGPVAGAGGAGDLDASTMPIWRWPTTEHQPSRSRPTTPASRVADPPGAIRPVSSPVSSTRSHAAAEERALYAVAARSQQLRLLVEAMAAEHRLLERLVSDLGAAVDPLRAAAAGWALRVLFDTHLVKEDDLLLPALAADPAVSLAGLLVRMHEHEHDVEHAVSETRTAGPARGSCGCGGHDDTDVPVLDVRSVPHAIRHATVFGAFDAIPDGGSLLLLAPHDPLPLLRLSSPPG